MIRVVPTSLRLRLLAGTSLAIIIVVALLGVAIYFSVRHALIEQVESELRSKASALASMTEQTRHGLKLDADLQQLGEYSNAKRPAYFEIRNNLGKVVARSKLLGDFNLALALAPGANSGRAMLPNGHDGWGLSTTFTPAVEHDEEDEEGGENRSRIEPTVAFITVAQDIHDVHESLEHLRNLLLLVCACAIIASGAALLLVVHFALRPVSRVSNEIGTLNETDLSRRIGESDLPAELRPIVRRLNELLRRLAGAFERERAFSADVAHELRTPLSGLLTTLDVCRAKPRSTQEYESALDKSLDLARRLKSMTQNLLTMARAESGQLTCRNSTVDLSPLLQECWTPFQEKAEQRSLKVQWDRRQPTMIETDVDKLRIILTNALDNAVSHANERGEITIKSCQQGGQVMIEIANTGNLISATDMPLVFERFWRGDVSRAEAGVHCGLGLSLCRRLAKVMRIELRAERREPGWFVMCVSIPVAQDNGGK